MMLSSFSAFSCKEVVNCKDGRIIGYPCDIKFDIECGKIVSITVRDTSLLSVISKQKGIEILWDKIERIGDDVIIVNIDWHPGIKNKKDKRAFF